MPKQAPTKAKSRYSAATDDRQHLVRTWWEQQEVFQRTKADALRTLNTLTGQQITTSRLNRWLAGQGKPSTKVANRMLAEVLEGEVQRYKNDDCSLTTLTDRLSLLED